MIFRFQEVAKEFGNQLLFRDATAQCNAGQRVALIGRNGTGKTTLFKLILGQESPDAGQVARSKGLKVAHVAQSADFEAGATVRQEALRVFDDLFRIERRMTELEELIASASSDVDPEIAHEYESLSLELRLRGGYDYQARTESVLLGVGLPAENWDWPWERLSGGQQNRLLLARTLLVPADLLLLDEPTNHLDISSILWIIAYLKSISSAILTISHDRQFLDAVTDETWEIEGKRLHCYRGSFSKARQARRQRLERERTEYQRQQEWKTKTEDFIRRNIVGQKTKQAQSRRRQLEKTEWLEAPREDALRLKLNIPEGRRGGALSFRFGAAQLGYPGKTVLNDVDLQVRRGERIGVIGGNGSGKTTLIRTLVGDLVPLGGEVEWGPNIDLSYYSQNPSLGSEDRNVYDFLRELDSRSSDEELRSFAALFLFRGDEIRKRIDRLSGGERSRLALARLLYDPANVLILDEPTNHLDISSREDLEGLLQRYDGTLFVVSHDLYFLKKVVDQHYLIRDGGLTRIDNLDRLDCEENARPRSGSNQSGSRGKPDTGLSKNERRKLQRTVGALEERVEGLEQRKAELVVRLQESSLEYQQLEELSREHRRLEQELNELYEEWERSSQRLSSENDR